jgi:hypothetical protein
MDIDAYALRHEGPIVRLLGKQQQTNFVSIYISNANSHADLRSKKLSDTSLASKRKEVEGEN